MVGNSAKADTEGNAIKANVATTVKKALIVTTVSGFVPQFEMNNVRILQSMGYEVHYASNFRNPSYGNDNSRLNGTGIVRHQVNFVRSPFQLKENYKAYRQLKSLLAEQHFELLHCHTPVGAALARFAAAPYRKQSRVAKRRGYVGQGSIRKAETEIGTGIKVVYTAHGFHFYKGAPLRYWLLFYPVEQWLAGFTDVLITINEEDYRRAKRFCRHKKTRVERIVGTGVDIAYFAGKDLQESERESIRRTMRKKLSVEEDELLFLSVGELIPRKNHSAVIKALEGLEKNLGAGNKKASDAVPSTYRFRYIISGQGVLRKELQRQIDAVGLSEKVCLLGYHKDVRKLLYAADVFVFPSLQEGMPVALLEAIAAGVPVIASDIRGSRELLKKQKEAVAFTDEESLQLALKHALERHEESIAESISGREGQRQGVSENMECRMQGQAGKGMNAERTSGSKLVDFDIQQVGRRMRNIYKEVSQ